ncbi:MAG: gamma-glutamyl-gamma-aminobutyrate hydrolase family protein [Pseudomonadota bacterium]
MKIGILETGLLREQLADRFDPYPVMFERFLNLSGADFKACSYSVIRGEMPASVYDCDGWLITGSKHGVYENLEWMLKLQEFVREIAESGVPLAGICFGHQIIAQALGGNVVKSDKGWGVGLHQYQIDISRSWMQPESEQIKLYAYHQDQVVELPENAEVFASSDFCPYAGLIYGDSIISVQAHPEFEKSYEVALLDLFGSSIMPVEVAQKGYRSMENDESDQLTASCWLSRFFLNAETVSAASNG